MGGVLLSSALALVTAGCGGGGGGGGQQSAADAYSGPKGAVTVADDPGAVALAGNVNATVHALSVFDPGTLGAGVSGTSAFEPASLNHVPGLDAMIAWDTPMVASAPKSQPCPGGGQITIEVSGHGSAGSWKTWTFDNCLVPMAETRYRGTITLTVTSGTFDVLPFAFRWNFDQFRYEHVISGVYTGEYYAWQGALTDTETTNSTTLTTPGFYYGYNAKGKFGVLLQNFTLANTTEVSGAKTFAVDGTVASTAIGGKVVIDTVSPMTTPSGYSNAQSGQIVVAAGSGARVRLTATGESSTVTDQITVERDHDSTDPYDTIQTMLWSDL